MVNTSCCAGLKIEKEVCHIIIKVEKGILAVEERESFTSRSVNAYKVQFQFSADWEGLTRTAIFKAGGERRSVLLDKSDGCTVPWEMFVKPHVHLLAGVCGTREENVVVRTVWLDLGIIHPGAIAEEMSQPPTPDLWVQRNTYPEALKYQGFSGYVLQTCYSSTLKSLKVQWQFSVLPASCDCKPYCQHLWKRGPS